MKQLLLIDANSIIHRAFHALPPFTGPDGRPTGALYGISAMLLTLFRTERPEYAAALFDRLEPTFRDEKYKEYKAIAFRRQMIWLRRLLKPENYSRHLA